MPRSQAHMPLPTTRPGVPRSGRPYTTARSRRPSSVAAPCPARCPWRVEGRKAAVIFDGLRGGGCRDGGPAVAPPPGHDAYVRGGAGLVRPPLRRARPGLGRGVPAAAAGPGLRLQLRRDRAAVGADHLDRVRELRPDGVGPDLLPVGAEHRAVHHPHRARRDGHRAGLRGADELGLPGRRVVRTVIYLPWSSRTPSAFVTFSTDTVGVSTRSSPHRAARRLWPTVPASASGAEHAVDPGRLIRIITWPCCRRAGSSTSDADRGRRRLAALPHSPCRCSSVSFCG